LTLRIKSRTITGDESQYFLAHRQLEIFGNVKTVFPDGFELHSNYLKYLPETHKIEIPVKYEVHGIGQPEGGKKLQFASHGLDYWMKDSLIRLSEAVRVTVEKINQPDPPGTPPDLTVITSDQCIIDRKISLAKFTMNPGRSNDTRYVHISQPKLLSRSRKTDLHYGNFSSLVQYMTAYEDVLIVDKGAAQNQPASEKSGTPPPSIRYATGGRADFDSMRDVIVMTKFPQVYQDQDTVTGDIITIHRDTDIIDIEHSNAFNEGTQK
jgi:hypothetical protein